MPSHESEEVRFVSLIPALCQDGHLILNSKTVTLLEHKAVKTKKNSDIHYDKFPWTSNRNTIERISVGNLYSGE